jgi:serine/threonine protein kinase
MSLYLSIYKEILKSMAIIHSHNVTHYDLKCDNVLLDFNGTNSNTLSKWAGSDDE